MADWESFRKNHYELLGNAIVKNLDKKGYSAEYVATAEGAKRKIIDLIPERASVGVPGSVTLRELGLLEALEKRANKIVHHWDPSLVGEERIRRLQEELSCDVFLTSANALTIDGTIVNIDGTGNRVAGMAWTSGKIIYVIGINKVCAGGLEA
ncbi:MAG: lactate utilization protein, partial [Acetomicrobium sp.]